MARDVVTLYNTALSAVSSRGRISTPTENSREAEICNLWYETVRDQILAAAPWSCARTVANLALISERNFDAAYTIGDPEPPWRFAYSLPADFIYPRFLDTFDNFLLGQMNNQRVLYTGLSGATLIYTNRQTIPAVWDADLWLAMIQGLAGFICKPLNGKTTMAADAINMANAIITRARVQSANEDQIEYDSIPDWLIARGAIASAVPNRFIYQNGPLLSVNAVFA